VGLLVPAVASDRRRVEAGSSNLWSSVGNTWGSTTGVTCTASATPHALPASPTEILAAADNTVEAEWIRVYVHGMHASITNTDALLNIYIGGAGSETLFIDSLSVGWSPTLDAVGLPFSYWFPVRIPRGTRVSASLRALVASDTCEVLIELGVSNGRHWVGSGVETLGEDTANSRGTAVTPETTGSGWVSIGTSGRRYRHIALGVQGNNDISLNDGWLHWYVGSGSAILQDCGALLTRLDQSENHEWVDVGRWCDIASGTALQLNSYSSTGTSGLVYATLHGVY
jgi:hypothetical protein